MKILYCITDLEYGGAERQLAYLASELSRRGHEVHVASRSGGPNLERLLSAGVVWHRLGVLNCRRLLPFRLANALLIFFSIIGLIQKLRPAIVQTILAPMDILGGAAALLTRTPWILKECSSPLIYQTYRKYWFRFLFGRLANAIVANSASGFNYWQRARKGRRLQMIPNGIPLAEIAAVDAARAVNFALGPRQNIVLYAGRVDIGKNVEAVISALTLIVHEVPFTAIICGEGPHRLRVEQMARELGIADRIIFNGYVDNLWELMKHANAFVFMSRCEGRPNVVLEAMACGCPLVVSDIPAHREILDEHSAMFADPLDAVETAAAIKATLMCQDAAYTRSRAARARALESPIQAMVQNYEQLYLGLLSEVCASHQRDAVSCSESA